MTRTRKVFKQDLQKINWEELTISNYTNILYKHLFQYLFHLLIDLLTNIYDKNFPLLETEVKLKDL